jgi:sugar phosphate isomerase/epimerase
MKTGIFNWFGYVLPIAERIKLIKEAGFDNVMLWWEDEDFPHFTDKKTFVTLAQEFGLGIDNIHLPYEDCNLLWSDSASDRESYVNIIIKYLEGCKSAGAEKVVMHTNRGSLTDVDYKNGYKSFEQIVNYAEAIKIKVAIENTKKFEYTEFVLKEFDSKYLGFCYDSSHDFINGESKGLILNKWKDKLFCVHLSDNDGTDDKHWLPKKGIVDFKTIVSTIKTTACDSLSMEVYPAGEEKKLSPAEFLKLAYEVNRSLVL